MCTNFVIDVVLKIKNNKCARYVTELMKIEAPKASNESRRAFAVGGQPGARTEGGVPASQSARVY